MANREISWIGWSRGSTLPLCHPQLQPGIPGILYQGGRLGLLNLSEYKIGKIIPNGKYGNQLIWAINYTRHHPQLHPVIPVRGSYTRVADFPTLCLLNMYLVYSRKTKYQMVNMKIIWVGQSTMLGLPGNSTARPSHRWMQHIFKSEVCPSITHSYIQKARFVDFQKPQFFLDFPEKFRHYV